MKVCIRLAAIRLAIIATLACSAALAGEKIDRKIEKDAKRVIMMFRRGMRFFPDQPDAMRIEQMMLDELS